MADASLVTGFSLAKLKTWLPAHALSNTLLGQLWGTVTLVTSLVNGIATFFVTLYNGIPPFFDRMAQLFSLCHDWITRLRATSQNFDTTISGVVDKINQGQPSVEGGSTLWDLLKYTFNVDAVSDALGFLVGVGWFWMALVLIVLGIATAFLVSGSVIYVTRRFIVFVSGGLVHVS